MGIELPDEARARSIASIRRYFREELDQDIGDLKAGTILDYFLREIAPSVHNAAVELSQTYLRDRVADLGAIAEEVEFGYWPKSASRKPGGR